MMLEGQSSRTAKVMKASVNGPANAKEWRAPPCTPSPQRVSRGTKRKLGISALGGSVITTRGLAEDVFFLTDEKTSPLLSRFLSPPGLQDQIIRSLATRVR